VLQELGERVHCHHAAANCPHATVQAVFAECPPSDSEEHCCLGILSGDVPCSQEQCTHLRTTIGWHSMELVSKLFDTPTVHNVHHNAEVLLMVMSLNIYQSGENFM
jgi:hypothetical protein